MVNKALNLKQFMLRQKSLRLYREFLKTIKNIPLESDRQQFFNWVNEDFKKHKLETDEYCIKSLQKRGEKSLNDLKLNLALSSPKTL
ncbi:Complex 1 LYR protein [Cinara cedri]|uniref:LYR motif-containing protein 2 n=1 Tax=Cinara cedri TaxID=506608 RepID=A0A5E4N447_9HEMI|nr:Complex 1 LYR protein [Cinara cedri]